MEPATPSALSLLLSPYAGPVEQLRLASDLHYVPVYEWGRSYRGGYSWRTAGRDDLAAGTVVVRCDPDDDESDWYEVEGGYRVRLSRWDVCTESCWRELQAEATEPAADVSGAEVAL